MDSKDKILACLHILKRLPPAQIQKHADSLAALIPDQAEELYSKIDKPLDVGTDDTLQIPFIQSEFNRDADSFRSPYTNTYYPPLEDGVLPSERLRSMEEKANQLLAEYRKLYYEGGVSSAFFWDKDDGNFATAWLIRKDVDQVRGVKSGSWSSINVIDVKAENGNKWVYKITTSVVLEMTIEKKETGNFNVCGSLTKTKEDSQIIKNNFDIAHLEKIGTLVEEMEGQLRGYLDSIYVGKTKDIIFNTRLPEGEKEYTTIRKQLARDLQSLAK